jgi:hypothetical protein
VADEAGTRALFEELDRVDHVFITAGIVVLDSGLAPDSASLRPAHLVKGFSRHNETNRLNARCIACGARIFSSMSLSLMSARRFTSAHRAFGAARSDSSSRISRSEKPIAWACLTNRTRRDCSQQPQRVKLEPTPVSMRQRSRREKTLDGLPPGIRATALALLGPHV